MMSRPEGEGRNVHRPAVASGRAALRTVGVTAGRHGEGTTRVAVELARTLATPGTRVLLVEGNLRTPSLTEVLGLAAGPGLTEFLTGEIRTAALVRASGIAGVFFVGAGVRPAAVDALAIAGAVAELAPQFDYVVLDLPPIDTYPDTFGLVPVLDGVVFVVDPEVTPIDDAERFMARWRETAGTVFGVVLNARGALGSAHRAEGAQRPSGAAAA